MSYILVELFIVVKKICQRVQIDPMLLSPYRKSKKQKDMQTSAAHDQDDANEEDIVEESITAENNHVITKVGTLGTVPSSVKMKLNSFCTSKLVKAHVQSTVMTANVVLGEAYAFANFHVRRLRLVGESMPIIDDKFCWRAIMAVTINRHVAKLFTPDWIASIGEYDALRPSKDVKADIRGNFNAVACSLRIVMRTAMVNHLWLNLDKRVGRFIAWQWPSLKRFAKKIQMAVTVFNKKPTEETFPDDTPKAILARQVISELRTLLPDVSRFDTRAHKTLDMYFHLLEKTEEEVERRRELAVDDGTRQKTKRFNGRLFDILPLKSNYTLSHIPISSMAYMQILLDCKLVEYQGTDGASKLDHGMLWAKHFNLNAIETRNRRFAGIIYTDGCAVSALLTQCCTDHVGLGSITPDDLRIIMSHPRSLIVAVDPGITDVVTFATSDGKNGSYSGKRYYEDAKIKLSMRRTKKWNNETYDVTRFIPTSKTSSFEKYKSFVKSYLTSFQTLLQHRASMGYRNMRFLRYVFKKKTVSMIGDMIAPRDRIVVVGFGDWRGPNGSPISRKCTGPLQEIRRELRARSNVSMYEVDEAYTSKRCCCCHGDVVNMRGTVVTGEEKKKKIHKVLHCHKNSIDGSHGREARCGLTFDRDFNASQNILFLTQLFVQGLPRPERFKRPLTTLVATKQKRKIPS